MTYASSIRMHVILCLLRHCCCMMYVVTQVWMCVLSVCSFASLTASLQPRSCQCEPRQPGVFAVDNFDLGM